MTTPTPNAAAPATAKTISINDLRVHCSKCSMRELCLPFGLAANEVEELYSIIGNRVKLKKGEPLFRNGSPFTALYAIRVGSLKTTMLSDDGREQIAGYHMPGDILGLDGMSTRHHECEAVALEDAEACLIPFERLEEISRKLPALQHSLHRVLGREIDRDHRQLLLLGSMRAEERLAAFLLNLSDRYKSRGYSSTEYVLRMTREEIGSFLGLKLETVSRLFSRFQEEGLVQVQGRAVKIVDLPRLKQLAGLR
jgi:CRP/FNR family transcriptional regulator, anaerobic regulatory protein